MPVHTVISGANKMTEVDNVEELGGILAWLRNGIRSRHADLLELVDADPMHRMESFSVSVNAVCIALISHDAESEANNDAHLLAQNVLFAP